MLVILVVACMCARLCVCVCVRTGTCAHIHMHVRTCAQVFMCTGPAHRIMSQLKIVSNVSLVTRIILIVVGIITLLFTNIFSKCLQVMGVWMTSS